MLNYNNASLVITNQNTAHNISWRSPSNLAIIKYWGKYGVQLPRNPSISLTLDKAYTMTTLISTPKVSKDTISLDFFFEGKENNKFKDKIVRFLHQLTPIFPFLTQLHLTIHSSNSFPHSAGIASSASAMSALALCLCDLENRLFQTLQNKGEFLQKSSFIARLGSGSACRSLYPSVAIWGASKNIADSSNLYAIPYEDKVHEVFKSYHDDILLVSKEEKSVSSRAGHALMKNNAYAPTRYAQANTRLEELVQAMKTGDLERFGSITENEALTLHALMMSSEPSYLLMHPNSLLLINKIRAYRAATKIPLYFSLDAGPNLHLLYPHECASPIKAFIQEELLHYCEGQQYIADTVGQGSIEHKEQKPE